jgi:phosphoribosylaminoimidazolecarboxamide formyltransferase/IMP cyclohydrolase
MPKIRRALLSVTDKTGIVPFAESLHQLGVELISTGGTAKLLRDASIPVREVSEVTGFPEMLDGRVKTMHPKITGGILAIRENPEHRAALEAHQIPQIDLVCVNLYEFEKAAAKPDTKIQDLIESIDIGGPTMIRSAAKNYQDVAVVTSPADYECILTELRSSANQLSVSTCWNLAKKAFSRSADYDRAISVKLAGIETNAPALPETLDIRLPRIASLRYGENPHQEAAVYGTGNLGIVGAKQLHGKELSYNNLVDLDAAWALLEEFHGPAAAIIKHTNPAGCAEQQTLAEAYLRALECDPVSAFGGVIGLNREVDEKTAQEISHLFVEAIAAPAFSLAALEVLRAKKNLRLLEVLPEIKKGCTNLVIKSISGGFLVQTEDRHQIRRSELRVVTHRSPTDEEWQALEFVWKVAKHVKSNAIVYARAGQTLGVGAGQMSRVDSAKLGAMKAVLPLQGSVVGSDAFFPFPDGLEEAVKVGATAFIQPGGSVKDNEVIAAADRLGVAMVFTGIRHFRH